MNDDLISRQAVLDRTIRVNSIWKSITNIEGKNIEEILSELPSINPQEPKTGHWKRISIDLYVQHATAYYKCSECGEKVIGEHNYCPNCGCRMAEPQESSV
jgi:predicted nucleic acid binding AN1-type Zn finger protein